MSNLTVFNFESKEVRFVGTADNPWWVAADVCEVLEHSNPSSAIARLDDDDKKLLDPKQYLGSASNQEFWAINESGLYSLVLTSRKPQAKRFKKWITSEVIPSIRKTGKYELPNAQTQLPTPTPSEISEVVNLIFQGTDLNPNLIAGVRANANAARRRASFARQHPQLALAAEAAKSALSIEVESNLLTPTAVGEKLSSTTGQTWSAIRVNKVLIELGLQEKNPAGKNPSYFPTEKGKQYGCLVLDTAKGHEKTVQHLRWYPSVVEALEV
jgi:prophage antirepressor-like protein